MMRGARGGGFKMQCWRLMVKEEEFAGCILGPNLRLLRNCRGEVLIHSRRAFGNIVSSLDANFVALMWAVESMRSHHVDKVVFETEVSDIVGAVTRPKAWPAFRYQGSGMRKALNDINVWSVVGGIFSGEQVCSKNCKECSNGMRCQSYVASGSPQWLISLFDDDDKQGR